MINRLTRKIQFLSILLILTINFCISTNSDKEYRITDFRNNPLGIQLDQGFYNVDLQLPEKSRIMAFIDFNNDNL